MKLRIRGNSIRLRLTETEVERLAAGQRITESTLLGGGGQLVYGVEAREDQGVPSTRFATASGGGAGAEVVVLLPSDKVRAWSVSSEEGIYGEQEVGDGQRLQLAVEKDYRCLTPRSAQEDPADAYPHPKEGELSC